MTGNQIKTELNSSILFFSGHKLCHIIDFHFRIIFCLELCMETEHLHTSSHDSFTTSPSMKSNIHKLHLAHNDYCMSRNKVIAVGEFVLYCAKNKVKMRPLIGEWFLFSGGKLSNKTDKYLVCLCIHRRAPYQTPLQNRMQEILHDIRFHETDKNLLWETYCCSGRTFDIKNF